MGLFKEICTYISIMTVRELSSVASFKQAIQTPGLVIVDCYATWCGPCRALAPILERIASAYPKANLYKMDVDKVPEIPDEYNVTAMPTILFFKNGKLIDKVIGVLVDKIENLIKKHL